MRDSLPMAQDIKATRAALVLTNPKPDVTYGFGRDAFKDLAEQKILIETQSMSPQLSKASTAPS